MNFVSESTIEQARRKRQEEWERIRKPHEPIQAPEESYDHRTLYERLKEQKDRKQEEYEEARALKNCVKGLQDDEAQFLENVDHQKAILENEKHEEELEALDELNRTRSSKATEQQQKAIDEAKKQVLGTHTNNKHQPSNTNRKRLSALVKTKPPPSSTHAQPSHATTLQEEEPPSPHKKLKCEAIKQLKREPKSTPSALASLLNYDSSDDEHS